MQSQPLAAQITLGKLASITRLASGTDGLKRRALNGLKTTQRTSTRIAPFRKASSRRKHCHYVSCGFSTLALGR